MTSPFSCRAREVTCHYGHVNRFCYLLTYCFTCTDLSYDPNLIMAALFMDLLVALTCGCLILFKTMLFFCASVLTELLPHPVYAWKQVSPLSILGVKNFHFSIA